MYGLVVMEKSYNNKITTFELFNIYIDIVNLYIIYIYISFLSNKDDICNL